MSDDFIVRKLHVVEGTLPEVDLDDLTPLIRPFLVTNKIEIKDVVPYCERVLRDFKELKPFLPVNKTHILSIGCGWGGHELYLAKYYGGAKFSLIDGTRSIPKTHTGFREDAMPYRNGMLAMRMLKKENFHARLYPVNDKVKEITLSGLDFVVSFCAWCHHFPSSTYLPLVQKNLVPGGHLLVDIRTGTDGFAELVRAGFIPIVHVRNKPKFTRVLFVKN